MIKKIEAEIDTKDFGNEMLYLMCKNDFSKHTDSNIVAGKFWIIGRSYAVSPERTKSEKIEKNDEEIKHEYFFDGIGEIFANKYGKELDRRIKDFKNKKYDKTENNDEEIITETVELVLWFSENIWETVKEYGSPKRIYKPQNYISFASKYLHFHLPEIVFILDNDARDRSSKLFASKMVASNEL